MYDNIEDDCMIEANKINMQFQFLIGASDSKPKPWMLPTISSYSNIIFKLQNWRINQF